MRRAPALSFLLVTVFVDMLGLGIVVPIVPALMLDLTGRSADAVAWSGLLGSMFGLAQFVTAPLLGRLADRYGRRPVLLVALACLGLDWVGHALTPTVGLLLVCHALAGACGGTATVVNAYVADVTPPDRRAHAFALVGSAFGLGFVAGPVIGGLLGAVDPRLPFWAAAGLAFANVAYGWWVLPESRPGDRTTPLSLRAASPFAAIAAVARRPVLGRLMLARFCADVARMTHQAIWTFFVVHQFAWNTVQVGVTMSAGAVAGAVFQARAVGRIVGRLGDRRAAVVGSLCGVVALGGTAFASSPATIYLLQAVGVLGAVGAAAGQSWLSRVTGADERGTVNGALTGVAAVAETTVPLLAGAAFAWSLHHAAPGAVFAGAAGFALVSTVLFARS
ncbi:MFS transporter, DHA1 family, tetracycline resistance protein [Asanoa hainanensis]|uniref:MFS transporter, DHA1 family, tetracycline resistance protein n=1 Tax=Asanoa hainanensis TaxID=560556 RepID=A0A239JSZ5_9ACTN|nr:MFS transporter [Asanoa hainanensis]SNT08672.1 MFS transporter, DHA1 family, tetracycline resistance protein [Asanoa hainanensis]